MGVDVRRARADDWTGLWPLLVGMGVPASESEESVGARFAALAVDDSWRIAIAVATGPIGGVLGYAAVQDHGPPLRGGAAGRVARLHDVFVSGDHRRAGVGRALVADTIAWASARVRYLQWQAHETDSAPFYERLGHVGHPCPQPEYPEFEIDFGVSASSATSPP